MKYIVFGDVHGRGLANLEFVLQEEKPDVIICTGDFDQTYSIRQFMYLKRRYRWKGKRVIDVPGNHDHAVLTNFPIHSGTLNEQGVDIGDLHKDLLDDKKAHHYLSKLLNSKNTDPEKHRRYISLDKKRFPKEFNTVIVHGGYDGDISSCWVCPPEIEDLWIRLRSRRDYKFNFTAMDEHEQDVMLRGHDHEPMYVYQNVKGDVILQGPRLGIKTFRLSPEGKHVITPGAWYERFYATIDTKVEGEDYPVLEYKQVKL